MANVLNCVLLILSLYFTGIEGGYCSYYDTYSLYYRYCPYNYYGGYTYGYSSLFSLTGGAIAGAVIGSIVFIGVIIALIVCCVVKSGSGNRATRGRVVQPTNQPTVVTTTSSSQAYPMYGYAQPPPPYMQPQPQHMQPQPATGPAPVFPNSPYPPPTNPNSAYPPNAYPPPPAYSNATVPK